MKPERIAITRKFNLGNYQTIDYHVEASLAEGEDPGQALKELEQVITDYWAGRTNGLVSLVRKEAAKP